MSPLLKIIADAMEDLPSNSSLTLMFETDAGPVCVVIGHGRGATSVAEAMENMKSRKAPGPGSGSIN
jgi:hypothetical protein